MCAAGNMPPAKRTTLGPAARTVIPTPVLPGRNCAKTTAASMTVRLASAARRAVRSIPRQPRLLTVPTAPTAADTPVITPARLTAPRGLRKPTPAAAADRLQTAAETKPAIILTHRVVRIPAREAQQNIIPVHTPGKPVAATAAITARAALRVQPLIRGLMPDLRNAALVITARIPAVRARSRCPAQARRFATRLPQPNAEVRAMPVGLVRTAVLPARPRSPVRVRKLNTLPVPPSAEIPVTPAVPARTAVLRVRPQALVQAVIRR